MVVRLLGSFGALQVHVSTWYWLAPVCNRVCLEWVKLTRVWLASVYTKLGAVQIHLGTTSVGIILQV